MLPNAAPNTPIPPEFLDLFTFLAPTFEGVLVSPSSFSWFSLELTDEMEKWRGRREGNLLDEGQEEFLESRGRGGGRATAARRTTLAKTGGEVTVLMVFKDFL